jgi:hypothetical protein
MTDTSQHSVKTALVCTADRKYDTMFERVTRNTLRLLYKITDRLERARLNRQMPMMRSTAEIGKDTTDRFTYHIR